uniref:Uncharacterized protein n=1 Tax=Rhizophora mucronata TaxID=61149 RepID=A0A2P2Q6M5_RHIMU
MFFDFSVVPPLEGNKVTDMIRRADNSGLFYHFGHHVTTFCIRS